MNYKLISQSNEQPWLIFQPWCGPIRLSSDLKKSFPLVFSLKLPWSTYRTLTLTWMGMTGGKPLCGYPCFSVDGWWGRLKLCSQAGQKERGKHWSLFRCRNPKPITMPCAAQGCIDWGMQPRRFYSSPCLFIRHCFHCYSHIWAQHFPVGHWSR